jgi:hypothetical protein
MRHVLGLMNLFFAFIFCLQIYLSWVMPRRVVNLFACWWNDGSTRSIVVWKIVPMCFLWRLWKEMNDRCFEDCKKAMGRC